jgi:periplasmic protein TonB
MKNTEKNLDDIIFEKRNKAYGAYALRKSYSRNLIRAMVISFTVFLMGISIPLIASYLNEEKYIVDRNIIEGVIIDNVTERIEEKLPELPKAIEKKVTPYTPPIVTSNPDDITNELGDLAENVNNNIAVDTNTGTIDIPEDKDKKEVLSDDTELTKFTIVEEMPKFPGGEEARVKFLLENIKYPQIAKEIGTQGIVYLNFTVEKDGRVTEIKLLRGIGTGCDEEAERVISMMPKWSPGRQNGRPVRVELNMNISFVLK